MKVFCKTLLTHAAKSLLLSGNAKHNNFMIVLSDVNGSFTTPSSSSSLHALFVGFVN
jgi:hypothetical protein